MSEPIDRIEAALRQIENHARAARTELAELRRSPPAPAIDVEGLQREVRILHDALERYGDHDSECYVDPIGQCVCGLNEVLARAALGGKEPK